MIEPDRLISPDISASEERFDRALRPVTLEEYVGQPVVKQQLEIFIEAARRRAEPLDHTLVFGPPGLGKTTLAHIIANEMKVDLKTTSGPVLEKAGDLAALLTNLESGDVLFIDEIHRLIRCCPDKAARTAHGRCIDFWSICRRNGAVQSNGPTRPRSRHRRRTRACQGACAPALGTRLQSRLAGSG